MEPPIKSRTCATGCNPGAGRGVRSAVWWRPNNRRTTKPCARIAPSLWVAATGRPSAALLGLALYLDSAAPSRLASDRPSPATRYAWGLIRGSLISSYLKKSAACAPAAMKNSIGIESMVLVREARNATRRALFFSSSVACTMPRIFF